MAPDSEAIQALLTASQNRDGSWGFSRSSTSSWTEPTCYAILALSSNPELSGRVEAAGQWLRNRQRRDGGWPPCAGVDESTWVTGLSVLALARSQAGPIHNDAGLDAGQKWLVAQTSADAGLIERLRRRLLRVPESIEAPPAWPWFPGTSSWVTPTALSILALQRSSLPGAAGRIHAGRAFLMQRRCADGGWNHGGASFRSENADSYPETTGLALLALQGETGAEIDRALSRASHLVEHPGSAEALAWLRLGLRAHGRPLPRNVAQPKCWTVSDLALTLLSLAPKSGVLL